MPWAKKPAQFSSAYVGGVQNDVFQGLKDAAELLGFQMELQVKGTKEQRTIFIRIHHPGPGKMVSVKDNPPAPRSFQPVPNEPNKDQDTESDLQGYEVHGFYCIFLYYKVSITQCFHYNLFQ